MAFSGPVYFGGNPAYEDPLFSVNVNAVLFRIGSLEIRWYGLLIACGMLLAVLYAMGRAKKFGVDPDKIIDVAFGAVIIGIIGARAYYVIFNYKEYVGRPLWAIFNISEGGLGIYGGIIFGLLSGYFFCKWRKVRVLPMFDLASLGFLIGQGIGRWGNFTNQEAFGSNTTLPWGMYSANTEYYLSHMQASLAEQGITVDPTQPVHPCFLYEFLWCLAGFLLLHFFSKRRKYDGQIFLMYLCWYGVGRFWIEGLRTDSLMIGPLRTSQVVAAVLVLVSAVLLIYLQKIGYRNIFGEEGLAKQMAIEAAEKAQRKEEARAPFAEMEKEMQQQIKKTEEDKNDLEKKTEVIEEVPKIENETEKKEKSEE